MATDHIKDAVALWVSSAMTKLGDDNVSQAMAMVQFYQVPIWDVPARK